MTLPAREHHAAVREARELTEESLACRAAKSERSSYAVLLLPVEDEFARSQEGGNSVSVSSSGDEAT